ncbi:MAG: hypothetical protein ACP5JH_10665, partial [Bacteroidota bacterium]
DTLAYPGSFQTSMRDIWGSSASDVYVVGHNDQNRGLMWHYDGVSWKDVKLSTTQGGTIAGPIDLSAIYGFSANDIWAVGEKIFYNPNPPPNFLDSSLIIHYDGVKWEEIKAPSGHELQSVCGRAPNDVWAGGINTLFHFDGRNWRSYPIEIPPEGMQFAWIAAVAINEVYVVGFKNDIVPPIDSTVYVLYRFDGNSWSTVDSVIETVNSPPPKFGFALFAVGNTLFSAGGGVYRRVGSVWVKMLDDPHVWRVRGDREDNLFAAGGRGTIYHYNGTDWQRITPASGFSGDILGIWTDGKEAFLVGHNGYITYILHGR